MMKEWQFFFWTAAFYNIAVGIPLYLTPEWIVLMTGTVLPPDAALMRVTGALLICFGIVYAIVGRDPQRHRPIVWAGLLGKIGMGAVYIPDWLLGTVPVPTIMFVLGNFAFATIFLYFLFRPVEKEKGFRASMPAA